MKIVSIHSSISGFRAVNFNKNFSIVLGVAKTKGEGKSHNLGKTTLIELLDHILFGSRDSERIRAIKANFDHPVFTVRLNMNGVEDDVVVDYSKKRKLVFEKEIKQAYEYFIRFQDDYKDEFRKISIRGKDITWKPLLLGLMGFDEQPLIDKYEIESTISDYDKFIQIATESGMKKEGQVQEIETLESRKNEILTSIDSLDFAKLENSTSDELASKMDNSIRDLKQQIFINKRELSTISEAIAHHVFVDFSPIKLEETYANINVYFGNQVRNDMASVSSFFEQISNNRSTALNSMKRTLIEKTDALNEQLLGLTKKRTEYLKLVVAQKSIDAFRELSNQLAQVETELSLLKRDVYKESIQTAIAERNTLKTEQLNFAAAVAREIDENDDKFSKIKHEYSKLMMDVMDIDAELSIEKNSTGNIEFKSSAWRNGVPSQELKGEMAKKISCAAFDVALRIVNNNDAGFIIHDGVIDNADKNIKKKFLDAMKIRATLHDFQYIVTAISDDLPDSVQKEDVVITLSDRSDRELLMGKSF